MANRGEGKYLCACAYGGITVNHHMAVKMYIVAQCYLRTNHAVRANGDIGANARTAGDHRSGVDGQAHASSFSSTIMAV